MMTQCRPKKERRTFPFLFVLLLAVQGFQVQARSTEEKARRAVKSGLEKAGVTSSQVGEINDTAAKSSADINKNSDTSKKSLQLGTVLNYAASGALIAGCFASEPNNYTLCAMGLMAAAQAASDQQQAGQSGNIGDLTSYDPGTLPGTAYDPYKPSGTGDPSVYDPGKTTVDDLSSGNPTGGFLGKDLNDARNALKDAGFKVTNDGMTTPDGKFVSAADMGSSSALSAAGISPSAIDEAQKTLAAVNDELSKYAGSAAGSVAGVGVDAGGGGYSQGGSGSEGGGSGLGGMGVGMFGMNKKPFNMNSDQKRALVAGKTVMFDGDPIGVRGLNIFDMMHIAYQKKRGSFIELESGVARPMAMRAPTSIGKPMSKKALTKAPTKRK
jgi:hypothetical protein